MKNNTFSSNILTNIVKTASAAVIAIVAVFAVPAFIQPTHAYTQPTLSVSSVGNGSVEITVSGDSDSSIQLFYYTSVNGAAGSSVATAGVIGSTAANGYFSTTLSGYPNGYSSTGYIGNYSAYINAIPYGAPVYVIVDGLQSASVAWPYLGNGVINPGGPITGVNGGIYFSASTINLNAGQSQSVQIYQNNNGYNNYGTGSYYISSNSNSSVVTASVSGSSIYVAAVAPGNATITVCQTNTTYNYPYTTTVGNGNGLCASLYVTVNYVNSYPGSNYPVLTNLSYPTYPNYPSYPTTYANPVTTIVTPAVPIVPTYIPATVYSTPTYSSYSYPYSYSYPTNYSVYPTSAYYPY